MPKEMHMMRQPQVRMTAGVRQEALFMAQV
jgi:hypothetical protein